MHSVLLMGIHKTLLKNSEINHYIKQKQKQEKSRKRGKSKRGKFLFTC